MLRKAKTRGPFSLSLSPSSPLVPARVKGAKDRQRLTEKREECVGHVCMYGNACVRVCNRERERERESVDLFQGDKERVDNALQSVWLLCLLWFGKTETEREIVLPSSAKER